MRRLGRPALPPAASWLIPHLEIRMFERQRCVQKLLSTLESLEDRRLFAAGLRGVSLTPDLIAAAARSGSLGLLQGLTAGGNAALNRAHPRAGAPVGGAS